MEHIEQTMGLFKGFMDDQFDDKGSSDYGKKRSNPSKLQASEMKLAKLKKEVEELKFYHEMESNEFEAVRDKLKDYEERMRSMEDDKRIEIDKKTTEYKRRAEHAIKQMEKMKAHIHEEKQSWAGSKDGSHLVTKLEEKDKEIKRLQKKIDEDDFFNDLDSVGMENELMKSKRNTEKEVQALEKKMKRLQRAHDDNQHENDQLKAIMKEMRNNMTDTEQELEKQLRDTREALKLATKKLDGSVEEVHKGEIDKLKKQHERDMEDLEDRFECEKAANDHESSERENQMREDIANKDQDIESLKEQLNKKSEEHMTALAEVNVCKASLEERDEEIEAMEAKITTAEKSANLFRGRARTEMDSIRIAVEQTKLEYEERMKIITTEKNTVTEELRVSNKSLGQKEQQVQLLISEQKKKADSAKKNLLEFERSKEGIDELLESHQKALKAKDIHYLRDKKKWQAMEKQFKEDLSDVKSSLAFYRMSTNPDADDPQEDLKTLINELNAEKSQLKLKLVSMEGKLNQRIVAMERELHTRSTNPAFTHYDRLIEEKIQAQKQQEAEEREPAPIYKTKKKVSDIRAPYKKAASNSTMYSYKSPAERAQRQATVARTQSFKSVVSEERAKTPAPLESRSSDNVEDVANISELSKPRSSTPVDRTRKLSSIDSRSVRKFIRKQRFSKSNLRE